MKFAPILQLLRERAGLEPGSLGPTAAQSAITARMRALGLTDVSSYRARIEEEPIEFQQLLDEVVVPETWFFRGGDLFNYLAEQIRQAQRPMRALSLPCSTGEEPYSLALVIQELGLPRSACSIDGVDLSARNIDLARQGIYPELSFRQTDPAIRNRYFRPVTGGWQILDEIRQQVRFSVGNILDLGLLLFEPAYDIVFCRNLFIYLAPPARILALNTLARLVSPGGLLCVGHVEPLDPEDARFSRTGQDGHFLYRRSLMSSSRPALPSPFLPHPSSLIPPARLPPESFANLVLRARQQADAGQLPAALELCRSIQSRFGPSADLYSLIGVIQQARGDRPAASEAFRKALYLAPEHREALMHLMLLCQQQGDVVQSTLLRKRLERLAVGPGDNA